MSVPKTRAGQATVGMHLRNGERDPLLAEDVAWVEREAVEDFAHRFEHEPAVYYMLREEMDKAEARTT